MMFTRTIEQIKEGEKVHIKHKWIPLPKISQNLVQAVIASEDIGFLIHSGFDYKQTEVIQKEGIGKNLIDVNTISQQTVKNVFLGENFPLVHQPLEIYFTILLEFVWGKERIMEVYLNSVEMGNGLFGAATAAENNFQKTAGELTVHESALIAVCISDPKEFSAVSPTAYMLKRQAKIISMMEKIIPIEFGKINK